MNKTQIFENPNYLLASEKIKNLHEKDFINNPNNFTVEDAKNMYMIFGLLGKVIFEISENINKKKIIKKGETNESKRCANDGVGKSCSGDALCNE